MVTLTEIGMAMREQAKHIPECLGASIIEKMGSIEKLAAIVPMLDQLIDGLKAKDK